MSQTATLYRLNKSDFSKIIGNPNDFDLFDIATGYETFEKTHEGLRFVLSKNQDEAAVNLINQLFYPNSTLGVSVDFEGPDPENFPEDYDFEKLDREMSNWIFYNNPDVVISMMVLLNQISSEDFSSLFDFNELNKEGIYPDGVWNNEVAEDIGFNLTNMSSEFVRLKEFYTTAGNEGSYVLSFVG